MKKTLAFLLTVLLIAASFGVGAESPKRIYSDVRIQQTKRLCDGTGTSYPYYYEIDCSSDIDNNTKREISDLIYNAIKNVQDEVNLSSYELPIHEGIDEHGYLQYYSIGIDLLNEALYYYPELYYLKSFGVSAYQYEEGGQIYLYKLVFNDNNSLDPPDYTKEAQNKKLQYCDKEINKIISGIPKNSTDIQKAVYVHDYIVNNFEYDVTENIFDVYSFFTQKTGVCQAYTLTYKMIMDKLGIECHAAMSVLGNHIWNVVKINNKYYYVDCTADDPIMTGVFDDGIQHYLSPGMYGYIPHKCLLLSSQGLQNFDVKEKSEQHSSPVNLPSYISYNCNDGSYNNSAIKNILSTVVAYNGNWYSITSDLPRKVVKFNSDFTSYTQVPGSEIPSDEYNDESGNKAEYFEAICAVVGTDIYINDPFNVFKYSLKTNTCEKIYPANDEDESEQIRACYVSEDGKIGIILHNVYYVGCSKAFPDYDNTVNNLYCENIRIGDLTNDGEITATDLSLLKQHLLGKPSNVENIEGYADLTRNNTVDLLDFLRMKQIISSEAN